MGEVPNKIAERLIRFLLLLLLAVWVQPACKQKAPLTSGPESGAAAAPVTAAPAGRSDQCIDLNSAPAADLKTLPGIGEVLSKRIVEYRERNGPFLRPEDIIIINGISERKFRRLQEFVCVR
jgi:competence protein ComEA